LEADPHYDNHILNSLPKNTLVFPILHGAGGEDGKLQKQLEDLGLSYLGSSSKISEACFDKWQTRLILEENNIPTAPGARVNKQNYADCELAKQPHVLKVLHGGSSIGVLMVREPVNADLVKIDEIFGLENDAALESLVEGVEITVPILDQTALPAIEVRPPVGGEFDYENKYNGQSAELCPPPSISENQHTEVQRLAEQVHEVMGARHLSRVDTIMRPDGSFVVLEINTIPGLTDQSLYPKAAAMAGLSMPQLVKKFAELVKRDYSL
jgi:D-alanine-D-alanine ligase